MAKYAKHAKYTSQAEIMLTLAELWMRLAHHTASKQRDQDHPQNSRDTTQKWSM
jgi:hypothetical protein